MTAVTPFPIHEYRARPHQMSAHEVDRRVKLGTDVENEAGVCVEHVRQGKPLTAKGAALLRDFERRAS